MRLGKSDVQHCTPKVVSHLLAEGAFATRPATAPSCDTGDAIHARLRWEQTFSRALVTAIVARSREEGNMMYRETQNSSSGLVE